MIYCSACLLRWICAVNRSCTESHIRRLGSVYVLDHDLYLDHDLLNVGFLGEESSFSLKRGAPEILGTPLLWLSACQRKIITSEDIATAAPFPARDDTACLLYTSDAADE